MKYVDVILPLPLEGLFTYAIPRHLLGQVKFGVRVVVPLGKSKTYTAMAVRVHDEPPTARQKDGKAVAVKEVMSVLDASPMLLPQQYQLWQWIADYYMSPIGEVYKAALPSGLKSEDGYRAKTETWVMLSEPFRQEQAQQLLDGLLKRAAKQMEMVQCLTENGGDLAKDELLNLSHGTSAVLKALVDRGIAKTYERQVGRLNGGENPIRNLPIR